MAWLGDRPDSEFRAEAAALISEFEDSSMGHVLFEHRVGAVHSPLTWVYPHTIGYTLGVPDPTYGPMGFYHVTAYTEEAGLGETYLVRAECSDEYGNTATEYSADPHWQPTGNCRPHQQHHQRRNQWTGCRLNNRP